MYDKIEYLYRDAGTIALTDISDEATRRVPIEELEKCGRVITVERFARFSAEGGFFYLLVDDKIKYEIDTDNGDMEEYDEEE